MHCSKWPRSVTNVTSLSLEATPTASSSPWFSLYNSYWREMSQDISNHPTSQLVTGVQYDDKELHCPGGNVSVDSAEADASLPRAPRGAIFSFHSRASQAPNRFPCASQWMLAQRILGKYSPCATATVALCEKDRWLLMLPILHLYTKASTTCLRTSYTFLEPSRSPSSSAVPGNVSAQPHSEGFLVTMRWHQGWIWPLFHSWRSWDYTAYLQSHSAALATTNLLTALSVRPCRSSYLMHGFHWIEWLTIPVYDFSDPVEVGFLEGHQTAEIYEFSHSLGSSGALTSLLGIIDSMLSPLVPCHSHDWEKV